MRIVLVYSFVSKNYLKWKITRETYKYIYIYKYRKAYIQSRKVYRSKKKYLQKVKKQSTKAVLIIRRVFAKFDESFTR